MVRRRNKWFNFTLHIYPYNVLCFFDCDLDKVYATLKRGGVELISRDSVILDNTCDGRVAFCHSPHVIASFKFYPTKPYHHGLIAHEVLHITNHILNRVGMKYSEQSEEAYTYLAQYITEKIYEHLK